MIEKFPLRDEPGKSMFVFLKNGRYYGHVIKDKTNAAPAKFIFETKSYELLEQLREDYPPLNKAE